ncbi:succinylglutamate desuccinylase [Litoribacillus peritrichatus]|uniref:Succinylglutamate desuccinylase n=1 Tax=Litoribacillus peritrichatus TaxID=718191 RepID=A0ABP7MU76_9GAMM
MTVSSPFFAENQDFLSETLNDLTPTPPTNEIQLDNGCRVTRIGLGGIQVIPDNSADNKQLIFSSAIHGNETAPIEVCNQLVNEILSGQLTPKRPVLFLLGNPNSMRIAERFVEENLNRLFLGKHSAPGKSPNLETERAKQLEAWVDAFIEETNQDASELWHYDLHTAIRGSHREKFSLYPYVPNRTPPKQQLAIMQAADVKTVLLQATPAGTFSAYTSVKHHAESFTIELGSVRPFGQNDLSKYQAVKTLLCQLIEAKEASIPDQLAEEVDVFEVCHEILNTGDGFELHIKEDVWNFAPFNKGELIWNDTQQEYRVGEATQYIVFPNSKVPKGQRAGLMLKKQ